MNSTPPAMLFLMSLWETWQGLSRAGEGLLRGRHDLTLREFIVLCYVQGGTRQPSALAEALNVPRYDISRTLARLETAGLLRREADPQDARRTALRLSEAGQQVRAQAEATVLEFIGGPLSQLQAQPGLPDPLTLSRALSALHPSGPSLPPSSPLSGDPT